jgi:redox-sensitive bicupin YhaK (pirin superfamily)
MKTKTVSRVFTPPNPHFVGDGFRVHNFIPGIPDLHMQRMTPFIMLDYNSKYAFPPSETPKGVGVHPHRGFETVTIAYKGKVSHHDSSGGGGTIGEGEVQWMTAGSGVLHKEYHEVEFSKKGGDFQMVQLWVNLPSKHKMTSPKYQGIEREAIPKVTVPKGVIEVIAGNYNGQKGAASTFSPIHMYNVHLDFGGVADFQFPLNYTTLLIVIEGEIVVNNKDIVTVDNLAYFNDDGETFTISAKENSKILILSGEPIQEPIAAHGPFVMNSKEEIVQAMEDFNSGKFGVLED